MRKRREARERAVQFLFQYDLNPPENLAAALDQFWEAQRTNAAQEKHPGARWGERLDVPPPSPEDLAMRLFADSLITGVITHLAETDEIIRKFTMNWELNRLAVVDRNVLRLAIFEMNHRDDIPPVVSINEAVDIAKKFSTDQSGKFVNGILDKVKDNILRPARTAKMPDAN
ncbi:MAG TPA: transcription antitermination factor NusB [Verrucomicrobiota bacterium]|nr:transcription antitermination factor NusB [Verrucomicrobiales bacterium]HRI13489.1 transcription antitermination factor NusB [Verrucomicrobiota bacterium]